MMKLLIRKNPQTVDESPRTLPATLVWEIQAAPKATSTERIANRCVTPDRSPLLDRLDKTNRANQTSLSAVLRIDLPY